MKGSNKNNRIIFTTFYIPEKCELINNDLFAGTSFGVIIIASVGICRMSSVVCSCSRFKSLQTEVSNSILSFTGGDFSI